MRMGGTSVWPEAKTFHYFWATVENQCLFKYKPSHLSLHFDGLLLDAVVLEKNLHSQPIQLLTSWQRLGSMSMLKRSHGAPSWSMCTVLANDSQIWPRQMVSVISSSKGTCASR